MKSSLLFLAVLLLALVQINYADKWEGKEITDKDDEFVFDGNDGGSDKFSPERRSILLGKILDRLRSLRERISRMSPLRRVFAQRQMSRLESLRDRFANRGNI